jgi:hypothetical protein
MIDRMKEIRLHQQALKSQKFYVSFDNDGIVTSVFSSFDDQDTATVIEIEPSIAEGFLSGSVLSSKYRVSKLGDKFVLREFAATSVIAANSSFYKVPVAQTQHTLVINKAESTIKIPDIIDDSMVLYICAKNCFHILYDTIVRADLVDTYSIDLTKDIDIFVPAHIKDLGIQYE